MLELMNISCCCLRVWLSWVRIFLWWLIVNLRRKWVMVFGNWSILLNCCCCWVI